jgi:hypothetical protein
MGFNVAYTAGGRFDAPFMPTKTTPYIQGRIIEVGGQIGDVEDVFQLDSDVELVSVAVGASYYEATDNWDLLIGNMRLFNTIYTKDVPEGIYLIAVVPIAAKTDIRFVFHNLGGHPKYVWVNYQCLR